MYTKLKTAMEVMFKPGAGCGTIPNSCKCENPQEMWAMQQNYFPPLKMTDQNKSILCFCFDYAYYACSSEFGLPLSPDPNELKKTHVGRFYLLF